MHYMCWKMFSQEKQVKTGKRYLKPFDVTPDMLQEQIKRRYKKEKEIV